MREHAPHTTAVEADDPDPRAPSTLVVGAAGVLITVLTLIGLEVLYYQTAGAEHTRKEVESIPLELEATRTEQIRQLAGYRWVDKQAGTVALPIERAMELIVEEHGRK